MSKKERRHFRQRESAFAVSECISISEHPGAAGREQTHNPRKRKEMDTHQEDVNQEIGPGGRAEERNGITTSEPISRGLMR